MALGRGGVSRHRRSRETRDVAHDTLHESEDIVGELYCSPPLTCSGGERSPRPHSVGRSHCVIDNPSRASVSRSGSVLRTKMVAPGPGARFQPPIKRALQHANKQPVMYNPTRPETFDDWWLTAQARFSNAALLRIVELGRPTRAEVAQCLLLTSTSAAVKAVSAYDENDG